MRVNPASATRPRWLARAVTAICVLTFLLRILGALVSGRFMAYRDYYDIAVTLVNGGGFCISPGRWCAFFPPVYPSLLAGCILTGHFHAAAVAMSSLFAAALVYLVWRIGDDLYGWTVGLMAAGYCAVYPYYIWHDTVVQENATLAFAVALAMWCLIHAGESKRRAAVAGVALGLCVLTKANLLLFALLAPGWVWVASRKTGRAVVVFAAMALTLTPWLVRTQLVVGAPVLYSNSGFSLFKGNNDYTFRYFPEKSIDEVSNSAFGELSESEDREGRRLAAADPNGIQVSNWLWKRGMSYIEAHPWLTVWHGIRKIEIGFSPIFSPRKGLVEQTVYFVSYFPILVGGIAGAWLSRRRWREVGYFYVLMLTFSLGTAIFWAHTSHRMYLDPYLMIFSAYAVRR